MNKRKLTPMLAIIFGVIVVAYNVILFTIAASADDIGDYESSFWISYLFVWFAFASPAVCGFLMKDKTLQPKDWWFGFPIFKHCIIYVVAELIVSTIFMLLDGADLPWAVPFIVQCLMLAVHVVLVTSCFMGKAMVESVQNNAQTKVASLRLLQTDAEMVAEAATDPEVKAAFTQLAEQIRFSDPMSHEALASLEEQISFNISQAKACVSINDSVTAMSLYEKATLLLSERNKKCLIMK